MRLPRTVLAFSFFVAVVFLTFLSLRSSHPPRTATSSPSAPKSGFDSFFRAPFSLFPPNAIITLTHENSTAFLARPAAFGPSLPDDGLNGRLWIGSGFGDDGIRQGTAAVAAVVELGCSDVPGWGENYAISDSATTARVKSRVFRASALKSDKTRNAAFVAGISGKMKGALKPAVNDGTDDYLNHLVQRSSVSKPNDPQHADISGKHADIQSIQEGAEIAGKIVLLSRGGCGFLEKVKWAQRRGAIALIVGDDTRGGPLIQMYAQGDTSNVSIPSVFTSRTTAHLLSSLAESGNYIAETVGEKGNPVLRVLHAGKAKKRSKKHISLTGVTSTATASKAPVTTRTTSRNSKKKVTTAQQPGWFTSIFFGSSKDSSKSDHTQGPSSGKLDWVLVEDWKAEDRAKTKKTSATTNAKPNKKTDADVENQNDDGFVIGVQDWRDPDLVGPPSAKSGSTKIGPRPTNSEKKHLKAQGLSGHPSKSGGGGSGKLKSEAKWDFDAEDQKDVKSNGLLHAIFGGDDEEAGIPATGSSRATSHAHVYEENGGDDEEEGLWVTITPTSGASPFLDTILVLVVSPLITLSVVYALLLVRSRIRRRRWRAPKSVVERLPVRTYQTISSTPGDQSPRLPSPSSSSAATPLLQRSPVVRPQSRTTGSPEPRDDGGAPSGPLQMPPPAGGSQEHEKTSGISPEWRKYMGRQVECVVCLEEYVDGVSRVMSLPCGHEFHADCITPWLVTRRRTCPICKGDVVRSLARGSPSNPRYDPYIDDSDDEIQVQAAETVNESSSSALPIPRSMTDEGDLETGVGSPSPTRRRTTNWRSILASSLGSTSRQPPQEEERDE